MLLSILLVGLGGFFGAAGRYAVNKWLFGKTANTALHHFPLATFLINLSGSFVLGFLLSFSTGCNRLDHQMLLFFGIGMMGSFTTFSTFSLELIRLIQHDQFLLFILYLLASVLLGLLWAVLGFWIGNSLF
ncbi:fluoride efflux transporter CrcB [Peptococcaceae bacterium]|nr:fluoride efflux transporter CrcB [Peptococcaceae bacterium]